MALSYSEIMGVVAQGGFDVRGDNYGYYLEAWNQQSDVMNSIP